MSLVNKVITSLKVMEENYITHRDIENYKAHLELNELYISYDMAERLDNLSKRAHEPMKLAVSGLFSSGKSTFLNAMLSDDILPSGDLPITSKITYLRYGKEPQLKLTYSDGREELAGIDNIANYVNQQSVEMIQSIDHVTLYYPKDILKNIVFVDTPGFNSPNKMDDETTEDILKNVDGIIWLTMISNAGKKSEIDVLEKYFKEYNQKSICIVNHKDEIDDDDEVAEFIEELKEDNNFTRYFAEVIPISALQALESRQKNQDELMDKLVREFSGSLEDKLLSHIKDETILEAYQSIMKDDLVTFMQNHNKIKKSDKDENKALLVESNIEKVFEYIDKEIVPEASKTLSFSLKKEMSSINNDIGEHYQYLVNAIDELEVILSEFDSYQKIAIEELKDITKRQSKKIIREVENVVSTVANILSLGFTETNKEEFVADGEKTFFSDTPTGNYINYKVYIVNREYIENLIYEEDGAFSKASEGLDNSLNNLHETMTQKVFTIEETLSSEVSKWKEKYRDLQESNSDNIELQGIALESFDIICNEFENQAIYFYKDILLEIREIYNRLCSANSIYSIGINSAFHFNESEERPSIDNMIQNLNYYLNTDWIKSTINGEESFIDREIDAMKKVLSEISANKLSQAHITKEQWMKKKELLE
ncbi:MAG: Dynamin [uncultured Sulfurovum sp.]|uniref:Dynamin n=1 Tax=uncultured Sulfurovum sp. TaxID=269237 RepID=A0A6S6TXF7_9BACT|nr:MAG: Dynamin [uncultured Sulfurovum sp.]